MSIIENDETKWIRVTAMKRKVIQLMACPTGTLVATFALCDDGSMWRYSFNDAAWIRLPDIPQEQAFLDAVAELQK